MRPHVKLGELAPIRGWVSSRLRPADTGAALVYAAKAPLPWRSITLLMPQRGDWSSAPAVSALFDDHDLPIGIELEDRRESVFVDDSDIFRSRDQ